MRALALRSGLPELSERAAENIQDLVTDVPGIIGDARVMFGDRPRPVGGGGPPGRRGPGE